MQERFNYKGTVSFDTASLEAYSFDISMFYFCKIELVSRKKERDELTENELFNVLLFAISAEADNN